MKKEVFELAMFLLQQHRFMDENVGKRDRNGDYIIQMSKGDRNNYEFDREPYYTRGEKYCALGMYHELFNKPEWKEAYKFLVDCGYLIENPEHAFHFKLIPQDETQYAELFFSNVPKVPADKEKEYQLYMDSMEWKKKRYDKLRQQDFKCEKCGASAEEVHHLTYDHLGNEPMEDLQALCTKCHNEIHKPGYLTAKEAI